MLLGVTIWSPGQVMMFLCFIVVMLIHAGNKFLASNPDVKDVAKKAAAKKAMSLIAKWLK